MSTETSKNLQKPENISAKTNNRDRDSHPNDEKVVEKIVANENLDKKSEIFAKMLEFINENLTLVIIASILLLALFIYLFLNYTATGRGIMRKYNKTPEQNGETGKGPPQQRTEQSNESYDNKQQETEPEPEQKDATFSQDKFTKELHQHIDDAVSRLHKLNKIESKNQLCDYIIGYTKEKMSYPATPEDTVKVREYVMSIITAIMPNLVQSLDGDNNSPVVEVCESDDEQIADEDSEGESEGDSEGESEGNTGGNSEEDSEEGPNNESANDSDAVEEKQSSENSTPTNAVPEDLSRRSHRRKKQTEQTNTQSIEPQVMCESHRKKKR